MKKYTIDYGNWHRGQSKTFFFKRNALKFLRTIENSYSEISLYKKGSNDPIFKKTSYNRNIIPSYEEYT